MAINIFDSDRWLEIMGEHEDKWKDIQAEVDNCNRELEKMEWEHDTDLDLLRKGTINAEDHRKMEGASQGKSDLVLIRVADLQARLNGPMYHELAMDPYEIDEEYDLFAQPRGMILETKRGRDTIRQYLDLYGVRVEVRSDGEPIWHCEGFDDQNRYS